MSHATIRFLKKSMIPFIRSANRRSPGTRLVKEAIVWQDHLFWGNYSAHKTHEKEYTRTHVFFVSSCVFRGQENEVE